MKKFAELKYSDELKVSEARKLLKRVLSVVKAADDYDRYPCRGLVRCIDEALVTSDGEVFLKMETKEEGKYFEFWVPLKMIHSGYIKRNDKLLTPVSALGDEGELWVKKIWARFNGWV